MRFKNFIAAAAGLLVMTGFTAAISAEARTKKIDKPAYAIYTGDGKVSDYDTMIKSLAKAEIIFIGETHNCPIAHWMEQSITLDLYEMDHDGLSLGAEMFERDNQLLVDEYVNKIIGSDRFESEAKVWDNWYTDYYPLLFIARDFNLPFIATNVPRRYASYVKENGLEALGQLSDEAKALIAPLPINYKEGDQDMFCFMQLMSGKSDKSYYEEAQALKDATMAWSIAQNFKKKFIHYNGNFHSDNHGGIIPYLEEYLPGHSIATVSCVRQDTIDGLGEENLGRADFIICVPELMTTTF